ncbi:hypothetical protein COP2_026393 [Malus domestica]
MSKISEDFQRTAVPEKITNEDLQTTLLQMLQRLEVASEGCKGDIDLAMGPVSPISLPLLGEEDGVEGKREERKASQPDEEATLASDPPSPTLFSQDNQGQIEAAVDKHTNPFSEVPVNMINLAWAEKGKGKAARETEERRPADKLAEGVIELSEHPKAVIIKGMVMCSRCQCECELEIPPAGVLIDHELIRKKEEERKAREKVRWVTEKDTSRNVFQRLGGDSQPRPLSEVFQNYEASEEAEDKEAKRPKEGDTKPPQYGHTGKEIRRIDRITNPVKKDNPARLGRKWYVVGKNGQPTKQMGASMVRRVQRQRKAYMNSLKTPATSETSKNQKIEKTSSGGSGQLQWRSKKEVEPANSKMEGEGNHVPQNSHPGKYRILRRAQEDMIMVPTPGWKTEPICAGIVLPERRVPSPSLVDPFGEVPKQMTNSGMNQLEGAPEPLLPENAMAWLDEFMGQVRSKMEDFPEPSNFHINMAYVLSAIFGTEPDQLATMEGDYLADEPMMAHVSVEVAE